MAIGPRLRRSARVIVVNGDGHVLLLRAKDPETNEPPCWVAPGGGLEPGEDLHAAACRELREETGHAAEAAALIGPVGITEGHAKWRGEPLYIVDTYFALRVDDFAFDDAANVDELEAASINDHGWFAPDQIESWHETIYPLELAELVREIHASVIFDEPRALRWV